MKKIFEFALSSKVAIYVPSTYNVSEATTNEKQVNDIIGKLSDLFGGATATNAIGGWRSESGEIIKEHVTIIYSYCTTEQLEKNIDEVIDICENLKNEMKQEAISLEVNNKLAFI